MNQNILPIEILDYIISYTDVSTLYELYTSPNLLKIISSKYIYQYYIRSLSIRLWIHQPGKVSHSPIDFFPSHQEKPTSPLLSYQTKFKSQQTNLFFDPVQPIFIDGCTIIRKDIKKHYSLSYHDDPILLDHRHHYHKINNMSNEKEDPIQQKVSFYMEKHLQWILSGYIIEQETFSIPCQGLALSCDFNFFNPLLLDKKLKQQTKKLYDRILLKKSQPPSTATSSPLLLSSSSIYLSDPPFASSFKAIE
ncbi:unnamed protein product [Cunninghamella blakesleeana]